MAVKIIGSGLLLSEDGGRILLRNFGNHLRKDNLITNKTTTLMVKVDLHLMYFRPKSQVRYARYMCNIHCHRDIISILFLSSSLLIFLILSVFFPSLNETAPWLVDELKRNTAISRGKRKLLSKK